MCELSLCCTLQSTTRSRQNVRSRPLSAAPTWPSGCAILRRRDDMRNTRAMSESVQMYTDSARLVSRSLL